MSYLDLALYAMNEMHGVYKVYMKWLYEISEKYRGVRNAKEMFGARRGYWAGKTTFREYWKLKP